MTSVSQGLASDSQARQGWFERADGGTLFLDEISELADHIRAVLQATTGRIDGPHGAARRLEINPHTLRARMRKLGIVARQFRHRADDSGQPR